MKRPMKHQGFHPEKKCPLVIEWVPDFASLEATILPTPRTVLLLAADAREIPAEVIARVAGRFLASGLLCVCSWGPDCERVHDIFDEVYVGDGRSDPDFELLTTWHADVAIEEVIWYFLNCAAPADGKVQGLSYVAITVQNKEWEAGMQAALSGKSNFNVRMSGNEPGCTRCPFV